MVAVAPKKLEEIAKIIDGEIQGDKGLTIDSLAISPESSCDNDLVLVFEQKYFKEFLQIKGKALIVPSSMKEKVSVSNMTVVWVHRPRLVLKKILELFNQERLTPQVGIDKSAVIDASAKISKNCCIGANVFIGPNCVVGDNTVINPNAYIGSNVVIGKNCLIYSNCTIYDYSQVGNNVILHSGVVAGSDGYSYVTGEESNLEKAKRGDFNFNLGRQIQHKIPSIGYVVIEDDVEIGANSCIDRGTIGPTIIGAGTKIDNLVQIAHNCKIGKDCLIVGQVGFAGSVETGDRIVAGGQVGFADNMNIGSDVIFVARSGVHGTIPSNSVYMGMPAVPYKDYFKNEKDLKRLPRKHEKLEEQVKQLENKIKQLEEKLKIGV